MVKPLGGFGKTIVVVDVLERRLFDRTEPAGAVDDGYDVLNVAARDASVTVPRNGSLGRAEQFKIRGSHVPAAARTVAQVTVEYLVNLELLVAGSAINPVAHVKILCG